MSSISYGAFSFASKLNKVPFYRCIVTRHSSAKNETNETEVFTMDTVKSVLSETEIKMICDKSRLSIGHRNLVNGRMPYDEPVHRFHNTVKYKRRMYGRYGNASDVDPGLAWPTAEDLEDVREYETVAYPLTIQEMQRNESERLEKEHREIVMRQEKIHDNMKNLNGWLKEVKEKAAKKVQEAQQAKEKKERLIEEVKKHFGYKMDPKDERFKEMLVKREKEEKKKVKDEKKKIREEKLLKYLNISEPK